MIYNVNYDSFTKIAETAGTMQNIKFGNQRGSIVEMSHETVMGSGILVEPGGRHYFSGTDIYLRCAEEGQTAEVRVVPFNVDVGGGGSSGGAVGQGVMIDGETYHVIDTTDTDDLIDSYFPD